MYGDGDKPEVRQVDTASLKTVRDLKRTLYPKRKRTWTVMIVCQDQHNRMPILDDSASLDVYARPGVKLCSYIHT